MRVIYFHGFASTANSSKVQALKDAGFNVSAPEINIDPEIAEKELIDFIKLEGIKNNDIDKKCVFVGTSLGGFWAARMGELFEASAILINPAMHPEISLNRYLGAYTNHKDGSISELTSEIVKKYQMFPSTGSERYRTYFIAKKDKHAVKFERTSNEGKMFEYDSDDHRGLTFFDDVIEYIKSL